jgi:hypothetical protein
MLTHFSCIDTINKWYNILFYKDYKVGGKRLERDDWGTDPQIRYLRQIFVYIEAAQADFLHRLNISPFDSRLRRWRETGLKLFEKVWMLSSKRGITSEKEQVSKIYLHCLAHFLKLNRIAVPPEALPFDENIDGFIKEVLK